MLPAADGQHKRGALTHRDDGVSTVKLSGRNLDGVDETAGFRLDALQAKFAVAIWDLLAGIK
jgi:hypothetical protein